MKQPEQTEWSYLQSADSVDTDPMTVTITADETQRRDLARRMNVLGIGRLKATNVLTREGARIHVRGRLEGEITQACVTTLEPIKNSLNEEYEACFSDREQAVPFTGAKRDRDIRKGHAEVEISHERDDPDPIVNGMIDLGELAAQYLSLAIDPYPRAQGVEFTGEEKGLTREASSLRKNPFEALKNWKERR